MTQGTPTRRSFFLLRWRGVLWFALIPVGYWLYAGVSKDIALTERRHRQIEYIWSRTVEGERAEKARAAALATFEAEFNADMKAKRIPVLPGVEL